MVQVHKANDYTSHGWSRAAVVHCQGRINFWPLCRHEETQQFLRDEGFVVCEGDDKVVHPGMKNDAGIMALAGLDESGHYGFRICSGAFTVMNKLLGLAYGVHELSAEALANLQLPAPELLLPAYGDAIPLPGEGNDIGGAELFAQAENSCLLASEIYLQLGRFEGALTYNARNNNCCCKTSATRTDPWQRARILSAQRLATGKGAPWPEIAALFEKTAVAGVAWGTPLLVCFALKDMLALVPESELGDAASIRSRLEEHMFELTMDQDSPTKRHLESGDAFMPKYL